MPTAQDADCERVRILSIALLFAQASDVPMWSWVGSPLPAKLVMRDGATRRWIGLGARLCG